jgi:hypothetical protein
VTKLLNRLVLGEFGTPTGIEHVDHHYPENDWEDDPDYLYPLIGIDEVLSIQGLVMKLRNGASRSKLNLPGRHGFAALNSIDSTPDEAYDGSLEEYLAVRIAKDPHDPSDPESFLYDQWAMRIRFHQNELKEELNRTYFLDEYMFSWQRRRTSTDPKAAHLQAWYANSKVVRTDEGKTQTWGEIKPIDNEIVDELRERLQVHMLNVSISDVLREERRKIRYPQQG